MERVEREISRLIAEIDYEEVSRLFDTLQGGKRLRAKLVLKIAPDASQAPLLAAIVELIHAASLLHDDVIDDASTRRGVKSVNATEGSKVAIMLGDILYSKAFNELLKFDVPIAQSISSAVTLLSKGEIIDVKMAESFNSDEQAYIDMLYLKTGSLIESAAVSAALLAGKDAQKYGLYGRNLGLSFQIIDDILDITSDDKTLGKPAMNDFVEGKCTLPYIYLCESLDHNEKEKLKSFHGRKLATEDAIWVKTKMQEHQSVEKSYQLAQKLSDDAMQAVQEDAVLVEILKTMMQRSY